MIGPIIIGAGYALGAAGAGILALKILIDAGIIG